MRRVLDYVIHTWKDRRTTNNDNDDGVVFLNDFVEPMQECFGPFHNSGLGTSGGVSVTCERSVGNISVKVPSEESHGIGSSSSSSGSGWDVAFDSEYLEANINIDANSLDWKVKIEDMEISGANTELGPVTAGFEYDHSERACSAKLHVGPLATNLSVSPVDATERLRERIRVDLRRGDDMHRLLSRFRIVSDFSVRFPVTTSSSSSSSAAAAAAEQHDSDAAPSSILVALKASNDPDDSPLLGVRYATPTFRASTVIPLRRSSPTGDWNDEENAGDDDLNACSRVLFVAQQDREVTFLGQSGTTVTTTAMLGVPLQHIGRSSWWGGIDAQAAVKGVAGSGLGSFPTSVEVAVNRSLDVSAGLHVSLPDCTLGLGAHWPSVSSRTSSSSSRSWFKRDTLRFGLSVSF